MATLAAEVLAWEGRKRGKPRGPGQRQKVLDATGAVVGGVLRAWSRDTSTPSALDKSNAGLSRIPGGRIAALAVIESMTEAALLGFRPGVRWKKDYGFAAPQSGKVSRVWPLPALLQRAEAVSILPSDTKAAFPAPQPTAVPPVAQAIKVKSIKGGGDKAAVELPPETLGPPLAGLIAEVVEWNAFAATVVVTGCTPPRWSRSFGPDLTLGGRFYAAGWPNYQTLSKADRADIRISGEPVVETDVRAAALAIMHGLLGKPMPDGDPYAIAGLDRETVKAWIVATLGKGSPVARWKPTTPPSVAQHNAKHVGALVCARYPFLRRPAEAAIGGRGGLDRVDAKWGTPERTLTHRLQKLEANAIWRAMRSVRESRGVLTLPVHDSLIAPASAAEAVKAALIEAFQIECGVTVQVTVG